MSDLQTYIRLNLAGNIEQKADRYGRSFSRFSRGVQGNLHRMRAGMASMSNGLDQLGNRYVGFVTGIAGGLAIQKFGNLQERLTRLGIQANVTAEAIDELNNKVYETANMPDTRVDPTGMLNAVDAIVEKTGDLK